MRELYRYLHSIGGCDATDEYSKGWDEAVDCMIEKVMEWKETEVMVVKFQKALFGGKKVLVYDSKETVCQELPMTDDLKKLFRGRDKMYCKCTLDKKGFLHIGKEVRAHF